MARPRPILTGIKLVHSFQVEPNSYTELILDFDAMNSIVKTGNGKLILKPTIKIIEAVNYAEVSGQVRDNSGDLGAVRVGAQTYASGEITEQAATYTDADVSLGYYSLPLAPQRSYNIVAFSKDTKISKRFFLLQ
jgi:PIN domain nuclease of toxin-antitoxin system